jgi:hypothetical protein
MRPSVTAESTPPLRFTTHALRPHLRMYSLNFALERQHAHARVSRTHASHGRARAPTDAKIKTSDGGGAITS